MLDDQLQSIIQQSNLTENENIKLKKLIFNPYSNNDRGKSFFTVDTQLDPDSNYYNKIIHHVDNCDYYDEETFKRLTQTYKDTNFSILHLNIRSILNKHDDLVAYLDSLVYKFSVIGLTETWLKNENIHDFPMSQYNFTGKVRDHKPGGGIGLYIHQSSQFRERNDLSINVDDIIESQFVELTKPNNTIVGVIYRPPNDKLEQFKQSLSEILQKIDLQKKKCYILGDFNVDLLKVEESRYLNDVLNCMFSSSFYPLISKPTRITSRSATLIDNIFVNSPIDNFTSGLLSTDLSDHLPIFQITISLS